jgi:hypothetical protein
MTSPDLPKIVSLLEENGYAAGLESIELKGGKPNASTIEVVLGEQPFLVVAIIAAERWSEVHEINEELVIEIANLVADRDPGARQLDLTIFLLLSEELPNEDLPAAAAWSSNTSYARRVVADGLAKQSLEVALLPVLPIRLKRPEQLERRLLDQLRTRLAADLGDEAANLAIASFERSGEVQIS